MGRHKSGSTSKASKRRKSSHHRTSHDPISDSADESGGSTDSSGSLEILDGDPSRSSDSGQEHSRSRKRGQRSGSQKRKKRKKDQTPTANPDTSRNSISSTISLSIDPQNNLSDGPGVSTKKKKKRNLEPSDLIEYGRRLVRTCYDPYNTISKIIERALLLEMRDEELLEDDAPSQTKIDDNEMDKYVQTAWQIICRCPGLKKKIQDGVLSGTLRETVSSWIQQGWRGARSDDTRTFRKSSDWWQFDLAKGSPINNAIDSKSIRGWNNAWTAFQNCPMEYNANEETYRLIITGELKVTASMWTRFMYPHGHVYNPHNTFKGLFYGYLILRLARLFLTGPSSVTLPTGYTPRGDCVADSIKVTQMTPELFAYIIVQIRFALCSVENWTQYDRDYDHRELYWTVVLFFYQFPEPGKKVLAYYDREIFSGFSSVTKASNAQDGSSERLVAPAIEKMQKELEARGGRVDSGSDAE